MTDSLKTVPVFEDADTLLPAIAQDVHSGEILMLGYMNAEAFAATLESKEAVYFSRSRQRLWRKGETSGHTQKVLQVLIDCDADTILMKVEQTGVACHEGYDTCFFREISSDGVRVVAERRLDPDKIYDKKK